MARKTAFVNEMILKTLNQHQQNVPPAVKKEATLDDDVGENVVSKNVNDHNKAKLYSDVLQKYLTAREQITPTGSLSPLSMYGNESTVPKELKESRVVLVHKSGSKKELKHYRPVAIINVVCKLFMMAL